MKEDTRPLLSKPHPNFSYLQLDDVRILFQEQIDVKTVLLVVGNPSEASYEWIIRRDADGTWEYSDGGYGDNLVALRDGLCHYFDINYGVVKILELLQKSVVEGCSRQLLLSIINAGIIETREYMKHTKRVKLSRSGLTFVPAE